MTHDQVKIMFILGRGALGGVERHVQAILRHLDRSRFEPSVAVLMGSGEASDEIAVSGVPVHVLNGRSGRDPAVIIRLCGLLRRTRPHLVHAHEMHLAPGMAMRLSPSIKWVQTEHCAFDHGPSPGKARLLWRAFQGGMDSILTVSRATGDALSRNTGISRGRIKTVFNGVDVSLLPAKDPARLRRELNLAPGSVIIGAVGRMARQKGWADFISVADDLAARIPGAHFVLIGDGPEADSVRSTLERKPWRDRGHFLGRRADAVALIGAMDLFLLTSLHEELPTTLLEAFAMRTPVAGYVPEGGVAEILELAGGPPPARLTAERNAAVLGGAVQELLNDAAARDAMVGSASRVLSMFDMAGITRVLEAEYLRLAGAVRP